MWTLFPASCWKMLQLFSTAYIMEYIMYPRCVKIFLPEHQHNKDACALKSECFLCKQRVLSFPELFQFTSASLTSSLAENNLQSAGLLSRVLSGRIKSGNSCKLRQNSQWLITLQCVSCSPCQILQNKSWHVSGVLKDWHFPLDYTSWCPSIEENMHWRTYSGSHRQHSPCFI